VTEDYGYTTTAPSMNGDPPLPRRVGTRTMVPMSWVGETIRLEYADASGKGRETSATLLDWCPVGLLLSMGGGKTLLPWEKVALVELVEGRS
jgi:hypothetical protein